MLERELYAREGIPFDASDFNDNSKCVELIEGKATGLLAILDDVCKAPKGDDAAFHLRLTQTTQIKDCKYFAVPKLGTRASVILLYVCVRVCVCVCVYPYVCIHTYIYISMYTYIGNDTFVIHHYAASVTYSIHEFCEKNKDNLAAGVYIYYLLLICILLYMFIITDVIDLLDKIAAS
jgi:myosin heavy subunit